MCAAFSTSENSQVHLVGFELETMNGECVSLQPKRMLSNATSGEFPSAQSNMGVTATIEPHSPSATTPHTTIAPVRGSAAVGEPTFEMLFMPGSAITSALSSRIKAAPP